MIIIGMWGYQKYLPQKTYTVNGGVKLSHLAGGLKRQYHDKQTYPLCICDSNEVPNTLILPQISQE
jgi:hypothetical protein